LLDSKADSCAVATLDQQLHKLEVTVCQMVSAQLDEKVNEDQSSEKLNLDVATVSNCVDEIVRAKLQEDREEEEEMEKRKTSVIIHGVAELMDQNTDNRIKEDNDQIEALLHKLWGTCRKKNINIVMNNTPSDTAELNYKKQANKASKAVRSVNY